MKKQGINTGRATSTRTSVGIAMKPVDRWLIFPARYEKGKSRPDKNTKEFKPAEKHLEKQGRFKHLGGKGIEEIIKYRGTKWESIRKNRLLT